VTRQFIPDDTEALREWAGSLSSIASLAKARVNDLGNIASTVGQAGEGTAVNAIRSSLTKLQGRLTTASDHLSKGAGVLTNLADTLDRLEEDAERKFRHYGSPARFTPKWVEYETFGDPWAETTAAHHAKSAAAKKLQQLAEEAPGAEHHESAWQRFLDHVKNGAVDVGAGVVQEGKDIYHVGKDVVIDLGGEVVGIAQTGWGLAKLNYELGPVNLLTNPAGWATSWKHFTQTGEYILTHKTQIAGALWDGLIDKDMWHKDKAAWAIVLVINILGAKGLGKLGSLARGGEGLEAAARVGTGVADVGADTTSGLGKAAVVGTLRSEVTDFAKSVKIENLEGPGHTIARHILPIGRRAVEFMNSQFKDPALNPPKYPRPAGGLWTSTDEATAVLRKALQDHALDIAKWLADPSQINVHIIQDVSDHVIGQAMRRYELRASDTAKFRIVLKKDLQEPGKFIVRTMFPETVK